MERAWLSQKVFNDWGLQITDGTQIDSMEVKRSYEFWERAETFVLNSKDNFDFADAIHNLKLSLNHRLKLINEIYNLKKLKIEGKSKDKLNNLTSLGIIRPFVLKELIEIRNAIEHEDKAPPTKKECEKWLDIIWYFLKSTDNLSTFKRDGFFADYNHYSYTLRIDWENHFMSISGWFPPSMLSDKPLLTWIELEAFEKAGVAKFKDNEAFSFHKDKLDSDIWVVANIILPQNYSTMLYKLLFGSL